MASGSPSPGMGAGSTHSISIAGRQFESGESYDHAFDAFTGRNMGYNTALGKKKKKLHKIFDRPKYLTDQFLGVIFV